jgi:hypothetical protein
MQLEIINPKAISDHPLFGGTVRNTAKVTTTGGELQSGLAALLTARNSHETVIQPLLRDGDHHVYQVTIQGITFDQFRETVEALINKDLNKFEQLAAALKKPRYDND